MNRYRKLWVAIGGALGQFVIAAADERITLSEWGSIAVAGGAAAGVWAAVNSD